MRKLLSFSALLSLLVSTLALSVVPVVLADCSPATTGDDTITCDNSPVISGNLEGQSGDDTILIESDVEADSLSLSGDYLDATPGTGNDTITNNGVVNTIIGDSGDGDGSGDDTLINNGYVYELLGDSYNGNGSGADTITNNGQADFIAGDQDGVYSSGQEGTGNDLIVNNGTSTTIVGDSFSAPGSGADTIINNNTVTEIIGDSYSGDGSGNDTIINNGTVNFVEGDSSDSNGYGNDTLLNNGDAYALVGDSYYGDGEGNDTIINNGNVEWVVIGDSYSGEGSGADTIVNNGYVWWIVGDSLENTGYGSDVISLNAGSVTGWVNADGSDAGGESLRGITISGGNDTVNIYGGQNVNYTTTCGNITRGTVGTRLASVFGYVDGGGEGLEGADTINFVFNGYDAGVGSDFASSVEYFNFEAVNTNITVSATPDLGPQTVHDDGVVMGYKAASGLTVCSGEGGVRAGDIDFAALDAGQTTFDAGNGWHVVVTALGGGQYQAHLFDSVGVEHFNDANHDGANDSPFTFSR